MKLPSQSRPKLLELEPRILFDSAAAAVIVDKATKPTGKPTDTTPTPPVVTPPAVDPTPNNGNNSNSTPTDDTKGSDNSDDSRSTETTTDPKTEESKDKAPETTPDPGAEDKEPVTPPGSTDPNNNNNSTTPTTPADGAGKSDEEKNDENVSGDLGNQGNNETKDDTKGNAGGDNPNNGGGNEKDHGDDEEDHDDEDDNDDVPTEVSRSTVYEVTTETTVGDPVTTTTYTDSHYCTANTENNKEIETTIRTYTDTTVVTSTVTRTTVAVTTITYSNGSTETIYGDPTVTTETSQDVTTKTREEITSTDVEDPVIDTAWDEIIESVTGDPTVTTEFVSETTVRTADNVNRYWIDTTTKIYRDIISRDTVTTTTRTPTYTITYCDGTVEIETGTNVVTTSTRTNTVEITRNVVTLAYVAFPLPPLATDDLVGTTYETPLDIDVVANDSDPDSVFEIKEFTQPAQGRIELVNGMLRYIPPLGFSGTTSFTYTIVDDFGNTSTATVNIVVGERPNAPPVARDDTYATPYATPVTLNLLTNDSDPDSDRITLVGIATPQDGTVNLINGQLVFTPAVGFTGVTTFSYTIRDPRGAESTATVTITVGPAPIPPVPTSPTIITTTPTTSPTVTFTPVLAPSISFPDTITQGLLNPNSLTVTLPASFTAPLPGVDSGLFVLKPPESVTVGADRSVDYRLPPDTFASTDASAKIDVVVTQTNGAALPDTIKFDPVTGKISGTLPPGVDILDITIEATDSNGNKARAQFTIRAGDIRVNLMPGKMPLTEQIRLALSKMRAQLA